MKYIRLYYMKHTRKKKYLRTKRRYTKSRGSRRYKRNTNRRKRGGDPCEFRDDKDEKIKEIAIAACRIKPCKYINDKDEEIRGIANEVCEMLKDCEQTPYTDCQKEELPAALASLEHVIKIPNLTYAETNAWHEEENSSKSHTIYKNHSQDLHKTAQEFANFLENEHYWMYEPPKKKSLVTSLFGSTTITEYLKKDNYFIEAKPYFTKIIEDKNIKKDDKKNYLPNETDTFKQFLEKHNNLYAKLRETAAHDAKNYKDISDKYFEANYVEDAKIIPGDNINEIKFKHSQLLATLDENDKKRIYEEIYDNILKSATNYNNNYNKISQDNYVKAAGIKNRDNIETITKKHNELLERLNPKDKKIIATYTAIYNNIKTEMDEHKNKTKS